MSNNRTPYNRRARCPHSEAPIAVREEILSLCRDSVEPTWKQRVRRLARPLFRIKFRAYAIGEGCQLGRASHVRGCWIGNFASFGPRCEFSGPTVIGDLTMLSSEVHIVGQDHMFDRIGLPIRVRFRKDPRPITVIESDCWIGSRVTIMEGVRIGRGSIVGTGAVVTRSVPPYSIAAGVPARVIKARFNEASSRQHDKVLYDGTPRTLPEAISRDSV